MLKNRFFVFGAGIALILLIIYLATLVNFVFHPLVSLIKLFLVPLLISAFFYYPLRPIVRLLEKRRIARSLAVMLIFLAGILILIGSGFYIVPTLSDQIRSFADQAPDLSNDLIRMIHQLQNYPEIGRFIPQNNEDTINQLSTYLDVAYKWVSSNISGMFNLLSNFFLVLILFPIMLFFLLRDDYRIKPGILSLIPEPYKTKSKSFLEEVDKALNGFIAGRVIINLTICLILFIGFLIIGLPSALLLAIVAFFLNFVPFIGAFLTGVPVALVALTQSPTMMLLSLIVIVVGHLIQNNVLEPLIFGNKLDMHPFTVIVLVLIGENLYGVIGMIICIPIYMTLKILIRFAYEGFVNRRSGQTPEEQGNA